jgi:hypothetical protein
VEDNTRAPSDQAAYQRRFDKLVARYDAAKMRLFEIMEERQNRAAKHESISRFMDTLSQIDGPLADYDEGLWCGMVEMVTVYTEKDVAFSFRDGSTIHVDARVK